MTGRNEVIPMFVLGHGVEVKPIDCGGGGVVGNGRVRAFPGFVERDVVGSAPGEEERSR